MKHKFLFSLLIIIAAVLVAGNVFGQGQPRIGIRGGIGTDVNLGIVYGLGANFLLDIPENALELGVVFFGGSF